MSHVTASDRRASAAGAAPGGAARPAARSPSDSTDHGQIDEHDLERAGLFDGLNPTERSDRAALVRQLADAGVTLDELARAAREDRLATLPVELVFAGDSRYTVAEMIDEVGLSADFVRRNYLALGLPQPDEHEPALTDADLHSWRMLKQVLDAGFSEEAVLELSRLGGRGAAQMAESILDSLVSSFLRPGDSERDFGARLAAVTTGLTPVLGPLTETPLRLHLRERIRREVIGRAERESGRLAGTRTVSVCFADLVEFTSLAERASAQELADVTGQLEVLAAECAKPPVRLVKLIGDAAMLVSPDVTSLVEAAVELTRAVGAASTLPLLRTGIASGPGLNRGGDWYGPPVNLANRISAVAGPGAVLADETVATSTVAEQRWELLGARRLKGISSPTRLFQLVY